MRQWGRWAERIRRLLGVRRSVPVLTVAAVMVVGVASPALAATRPKNTSLPTISGDPYVGQTLAGSDGTWTGTSPITYVRQWLRCNSSGNSCTSISGATGKIYVVTSTDKGKTLRFRVTAKNSAGSATARSAQTAVIQQAQPPANTSPPTISGTAQDGRTLTGDPGTWTGTQPITYQYAWILCDSQARCTTSSVTGTTYLVGSADIGMTITLRVTATNLTNVSVTADSTPTAAVTAAPPVNTAAPTVSGSATVGSTLSADPGTWSGSPATYTYDWQRCSNGTCSSTGGTSSTYLVQSADVNSTLRVAVTATNSAAGVTAYSAETSAVYDPATVPTNTSAPTISGTPTDGQTLTGDPGTWSTATPTPISYAYQWLRCGQGACSPIQSATALTYVLTSSDVGDTVAFQTTATTVGGSAVATSSPTSTVAALPPANTVAPSMTGTATDGSTLTVNPGIWSGTTPISYAYDWQRCDGTGANCVSTGVTSISYVLATADLGSTMVVVVTATNAAPGQVSASSAATAVVAATPPVNSTPPTVTGSAQSGSQLVGDAGQWSGSTPITFAYLWLHCDSAGAQCFSTGVTTSTYLLGDPDVGYTMRLQVTATNQTTPPDPAGVATSDATAVVQVAGPSNTSPPTVSGTAQVAATLTSTTGAWTGSPTSYAYHWFDCDSSGTTCSPVAVGDGASTYLVKTYDLGARMMVQVTASNSVGSASATSTPTSAVIAATTSVTVAHWAMDDTGTTMTDDSGYRNDGAMTSVTTGVPGWKATAFRFASSPSLVTVPDADPFDPGSSRLQVTFHVKFGAVPSATVGDYDLIRKGLSTTVGGDYKAEIISTGGALCHSQGSAGKVTVSGGPNLADSAWHEIRCDFSPTLVRLYVDGVKVAGSGTVNIGSIANADPVIVGAKNSTADQYAGDMDEVTVKLG